MQFKLLAQRSQSLVFTQRGQSHLALNSALNTRRVRRPDDLLMMSSCPGIFAVAKTHNKALICAVQFCRATSYSPPFVKGCLADAQFKAYIRDSYASLNAFDRVHDLAIAEF